MRINEARAYMDTAHTYIAEAERVEQRVKNSLARSDVSRVATLYGAAASTYKKSRERLYMPDTLMAVIDVIDLFQSRDSVVTSTALEREITDANSKAEEYSALKKTLDNLASANVNTEGRPLSTTLAITAKLHQKSGLRKEDGQALARLALAAYGVSDPFENPDQFLQDAQQVTDAVERFGNSEWGQKAGQWSEHAAPKIQGAMEKGKDVMNRVRTRLGR